MRKIVPTRPWWAALVALPLLAGCKSSFDVDLVVGPAPADANVSVRVEGVDLERIDDDVEEVRRNATGVFESQAGASDTAQELVTDADIDNGEYKAVRLILDQDDAGTVQVEGDPEEAIELADTADTREAEVAFDFEDDEDDDVRVVVALDLVLSLSQDDGAGEFTLDPVIRAMESEDAGTISGTIPASRFAGEAECAQGEGTKYVYAFVGTGVVPDERDGNEAEPIAVANLVRTSNSSDGTFEFRYMPPDDYTLAFTCEGEFENGLEPADDEVIDFFDGPDIRLDPGEDLQVEFDD